MNATIEHAREIAEPLSESLSLLEVRVTPVAAEIAQRAIFQAWLALIDDLEHGRANLSSAYLMDIHERLTMAASLGDSAGFVEHGLPILPDGSRESWSRFVQECRYDDEEGLEEEYALAQLRWGEHVKVFAITLGWFAMNIIRMRRGEDAIFPPPADHERLLRFLRYAGPHSYDAEGGLRGIARVYARQQAKGSA